VNCFDVNANNRLICAGTDELNHDVYLLFFDIRERRLMGGFFESHKEEVTDVKFHPTNPDLIASGSTDGLINVFDCKQESEEDALKYCMNTTDSVAKLKWHQNDRLSCISNTNELLLYDVNEQDLLKKWDRSAITESIKRKSVIDCNLVECYNFGADEQLLLATSNYNKGECLRSMKFTDKSFEPHGNFKGNSQIIRASLFSERENLFFTFGEGAVISLWREGGTDGQSTSTANLKQESSVKKKLKKKSNPY
jgi:WD repeat-containing protein 89